MIALDTSALAAIAFEEPDAERFIDVIDRTGALLVGAPTLLELRMVLVGRLDVTTAIEVGRRVVPLRARVVAFDAIHQAIGEDAFILYGKGRHPASLNFGDCMAYAVAKVAGCPLLFKGEDFARTDIRSALTG